MRDGNMAHIRKAMLQTTIALVAGILIAWGWFKILDHSAIWAIFNGYGKFYLAAEHLAGALFLLAIIVPYHRWIAPLRIGRVFQRSSVMPALAVIVVYLVVYGYDKMTGQPQEKWVDALLNRPMEELAAIYLTIFILAPFSEEIVFRGVLLNVFKTSRTWTTWAGAIAIGLFFAYIHQQYDNASTLVEMMAIACIFAWARMRSGGLLLPMLLHSLSACIAVVLARIG